MHERVCAGSPRGWPSRRLPPDVRILQVGRFPDGGEIPAGVLTSGAAGLHATPTLKRTLRSPFSRENTRNMPVGGAPQPYGHRPARGTPLLPASLSTPTGAPT